MAGTRSALEVLRDLEGALLSGAADASAALLDELDGVRDALEKEARQAFVQRKPLGALVDRGAGGETGMGAMIRRKCRV